LLSLLFAAGIVHPTAGAAQVAAGPGWSAWLGCWEPVAQQDFFDPTASDESPLCVLPTDGADAVELVTVQDGQIVDRELVRADGVERSIEREGCTGVEAAHWSTDRERVFQESDFVCAGELRRRSSGIFALLGNGDWATVHAVTVGDYTDVRVVRYRPMVDVANVSAEVAAALSGREMALDAARTAAASPVAVSDVTEAVERVDVAAIEGWLIERGQEFPMDAELLVELAEADVPERVIDLMVALSYPDVFAIDRSAREGRAREDDRPPPPGRRAGPVAVLDPFYYPGYYGRGRYYGGWYGAPVIIPRERPDNDNGGRLVNGRGYTRGGGASNSVGGSSSSPPSRAGSSGGGGSSSSGGSSSGRTAKPRS
jgi:hypothetical protein